MRATALLLFLPVFTGVLAAADAAKYDYRVLATTKTSTMEKELNEAAAAGYSFSSVMGGETAIGGKEVLVVMAKKLDAQASGNKQYKLLATSKTSTMQKELMQAGEEGFEYCGETVFQSTFGGKEVSVILERDAASKKRIEYKLLATSRTSTMQKELKEAGDAGFEFVGVVVGGTAFGGKEVVSILRRYVD
ncbi:MAG: hypothetical protein M1541_03740 [Acidobacteria bacterium]|nr:hypothetical protein [Acidobacteriota bacterium]